MKFLFIKRRLGIISLSILICLTCFTPSALFSQNSKIDSLKLIVKSDSKDTVMVNTLNDLSSELWGIKELDQATEYADRAISLADQLDFKKGLAYALKNKGLADYLRGNYTETARNWNQSLQIFEAIQHNLGIVNLTNNIGNIYKIQNDHEKALEYFRRSLSSSEKIGDTVRIYASLFNIGLSYRYMEDYDKALYHYNRIEPYLPSLKDTTISSHYFIAIGDVYRDKKDHVNALKYFNQALNINKETPQYSRTLKSIGIEERSLGNIKEAIGNLELHYEIEKESGDQYAQVQAITELGNTYSNINPNKALKLFKQGEKLSIEIGGITDLSWVYEGMARSYQNLYNYESAFVFYKKYRAIQDSVFYDFNNDKIDFIKFDFEEELKKVTLQSEEEIKLLEHEAAISELNANRQKYILYGTVITLILLIILAIGGIKRYKYVKKTNLIIEKERDRSDQLLLNILPAEIAEELKNKGKAEARDFDLVSILFTDFKDFTKISQKLSAKELIFEINYCFMAFDNICEKYGIEKIKSIGDSFMAAGGIPLPSNEAVKNTILAALEMQSFISKRIVQKRAKNEIIFEMRLGIHSGPVVAGIVGIKKFQYDIWGDTVNTASRMESNGEVGKVNVSQNTYDLIKEDSNFVFQKRGKVDVKGKGELEMYFVQLSNNASDS